jgi:hypothetical protein
MSDPYHLTGLRTLPILRGTGLRAIFLVILILVNTAAPAVDGLNPDMSLNRAKISKAYFEGDFDTVVEALESFRKVQPNLTREDKIYVYKYLSVIYAAKPETRAKAESFMYQLLKIMPSIELMDLYISDNIEAIFNSVRLRFEQQQHFTGSDSTPAGTNGKGRPAASFATDPNTAFPTPAKREGKPVKAEKADGKSGHAWIWWTAGAVGVAVAGFIYFSEFSEPEPAKRDTLVLN